MMNPDVESSLPQFAEYLNAPILIDVSVTILGDELIFGGGVYTPGSGSVVLKSRDNSSYKSMWKDMDNYGSQLADKLLATQICPYKGKITITNTINDKEIHDRGNQCGKNSGGYFSEHKENNIKKQEVWEFEKKHRAEADGDFSESYLEEKIIHQVNKGCINCDVWEGNSVTGKSTQETDEDFLVVIREENKVNGIVHPDPQNNMMHLPAITAIEFDTVAGTYVLIVKALSKTGTYTKTTSVKRSTSCRYTPMKDIVNTYPLILTIDNVFGPFKGKPSDTVLRDEKVYTDRQKHDGGESVSTYKISFSLTR